MLLPIDFKFPREDYDHLRKRLRLVTPNWPPHTLEFAILFIPTESLYAKVLRQPGLFEQLQRDYRVMIAGPTNLAALLTSLGRRASLVWRHYRKFEASAKGRSRDKEQETISLLLANRRWPLRRCRMILVVLGEDRLKGFLGPKFRRADFFQTGSVPI